ncbi:MAG: aminoacyl-tRNA hydrolase [Corynebacteriales bacterium]|nr:aminoacyl-tRNA hydrolase [Mycobacteriales bacterium]
MSADLPITDRLALAGAELSERFSRSSGPGGQGVNTTDSRVELSFDLVRSQSLPPWLRDRAITALGSRLVDGVLTVAASEHRAQLANRTAARERLARLMRDAIAPPGKIRRPTKPSRAAKERRLRDKRRHALRKQQRRSDPHSD